MCVTNVYTDRYPDGREIEFRKLSICQYGSPGKPCPKHSLLENPVRKIQVGEPTTEFILTQVSMPPSSSGGSTHPSSRNSGYGTSEKSHPRRKTQASRQHRKERIIIVDEVPRPRSSPRPPVPIPWTPPSTRRSSPPLRSPLTPPADEHFRTLRSVEDAEAARRRSRSSDSESEAHEAELQRKRGGIVSQRGSSSPSYARFDSRARREREELEARQRYEREKRQVEQEAELRRAGRIAEHNEDISLRAAVPPTLSSQRAFLRPIFGQKDILQDTMGGLTAAEKQRAEDRRIRQRMEAEEEAMRQRLRDRQVSTRRFSTGPGYRRHRVLYDDGVYRWEDDVSSAMADNMRTEIVDSKLQIEDSDGESEISADTESVFSTSHSISSKSSRAYDMGVSEEFVTLLLAEDSLKTLFQKSSQILDGNTFKQEFKGLLTKFSRDLHSEAKKATEILAARLVGLSRRRVAYAIWKEIYGIESGQSISGALDNSRLNKARKMEETLRRLNMMEGQDREVQSDQKLSDVDSSEDDEEVYKKLPNLQQVKRFLVDSQGFRQLQRRFEEVMLESKIQVQVGKVETKTSTGNPAEEDAVVSVKCELPLSVADQRVPTLEPPMSLPILPPIESRKSLEAVPELVSNKGDVNDSLPAEVSLEQSGIASISGSGGVVEAFEVVTEVDPNLVETSLIMPPYSSVTQNQEKTLSPAKSFTHACKTAWLSWEDIRNHVDRLFRPSVPSGHRRLEWRSECGTWLYDDFDNSDAVQLDKFYRELTEDEPTAPQDSDEGLRTKDGGDRSTTVPSGHPASSSTSSTTTSQMTSGTTPATSIDSAAPNPPDSTSQLSIFNNEPVPPLIRKYFAICVNTGKNLAILGEIEVSTIDHDGEYFKKMWDEYDKLRGFRSKYFRRLLIKPADVKYVQFTVEEHQRADISFDPPIIPPPNEVIARNYEYAPCPLTTRPSAQTFLHYRDCTSCVKSREKKKKLFRRLPKKLSRGLLDVYLHAPPDEDVLGWGVLIIEGPNKLAITMLGSVMLTLSVVVAVIYTSISKDASSGFTIGSFLVAIWVSWMTAFYYYCKDT